MLKRFFEDVLEMNPSFRSFLGDARAHGDYENIASKEYRDAWKGLLQKYKAQTKGPIKKASLDTLSLRWILQSSTEMLSYPDEWMLLTSYDNPILGFLTEDTHLYPLQTKQDVLDLISRTRQRIPFIQDVQKAMKEGATQGKTLPRRVCEGVLAQLKDMLQHQKYYVPIPAHLDSSAYVQMVDTEFVPALYALVAFLQEHVKLCRRSIGICHVPGGKEMYRAMLRNATTLDITPEEIHQRGLEGVKRLYQELGTFRHALAASIGVRDRGIGKRTLFRRILADDDMYYQSAQEVIQAYTQAQEKIRKTVLPKYFEAGVDRYQIRKVPDLIKDATSSAYYMMPSLLSGRPGTVYLNTTYLKRNPKYTVDVLSLHEGSPGHHYQYQYMKEHKIPMYRMYAVENDAYVEGWALYCEGLVDMSDPKNRFGRWVYDMFRTVRLVVDTGIHYYGWSYAKALAYLTKHVLFEEKELVTELERYICQPAQAVSYKVGEEFFRTERDYFLSHKMGDIRAFHRKVLECGILPLDVLRQKLRYGLVC